MAQILQNAGPGNAKPVTVEPSSLAKMPSSTNSICPPTGLPAERHGHPRESGDLLVVAEDLRGEPARVQVVSGATIPVAAKDTTKVVSLVKADTTGREADQVYFGPEYANFVAITAMIPVRRRRNRCGG